MANNQPGLPESGLQFVGYLNRRPYLWSVDLVNRTIEPAATALTSIPQGIDEIVPMGDSVGVRCGPLLSRLEPDLSGQLEPMSAADQTRMAARSHHVRVGLLQEGRAFLDFDDRSEVALSDDRVGCWAMSATASPDRKLVAIGAETTTASEALAERLARHPNIVGSLQVPLPPLPWMMFIVEVDSGRLTACEGTFENTCYPPAWDATGDWIAFGTPFDPRNLYVVHRTGGALHEIRFQRHAPMPMVDRQLLPGLDS